jgi:acetyltransferase-like isoleucine patch superfamily enzyme
LPEPAHLSPVPLFQEDVDPKLRAQILTYAASATLSDAERGRLLGLPRGCRIREGAKILAPEKFRCGEYVWIGEGAILDAQGGLDIGDHTQIGLNVFVWSHTSHWQALRGETGHSREHIKYTPTRIGSCCFIGGPSVISPGVTIGDRVIVPPMSVIESDLPSNTVFRPVSNRVAKLERRIEELVEQLKALTANRGD